MSKLSTFNLYMEETPAAKKVKYSKRKYITRMSNKSFDNAIKIVEDDVLTRADGVVHEDS